MYERSTAIFWADTEGEFLVDGAFRRIECESCTRQAIVRALSGHWCDYHCPIDLVMPDWVVPFTRG